DEDARFTDTNPAFEQVLGRPRAQLVGRAVADFAPPSWRDEVRRSLAPPGGPRGAWRGEFPLCAADGREVRLQWHVSPHVEPGVRIAVAIDVSEHHELELRRRELLEREQVARAAAERHSRTKDDFIA